MPAAALALVLTAALLHALWNIVAKRAGGDTRFQLLTSLMIAVLWAPVGWWAGREAVPGWGVREWALLLASGMVHLLYFNVLLTGYRVSDLTIVYPVARGSGPLVSALGAVLLLGERLTLQSAAGVAGVCAGVFLIAGGPRLWRAHPDAEARRRVRLGIGYGAATGLLIAGYTLIDGYAVKVALLSPILIDYFGNLLRLPFLLPVFVRNRPACLEAWRAQWKHALVLAAISPLAYVLVLYALQMAPLSHVSPAREVSMLFAALLGGRLLGEGDRGLRLAGAACIAAGVMALASA